LIYSAINKLVQAYTGKLWFNYYIVYLPHMDDQATVYNLHTCKYLEDLAHTRVILGEDKNLISRPEGYLGLILCLILCKSTILLNQASL